MKLAGIIFDLDGTLLNTLDDIAAAENAALAELGLPTRPVDEYRWIVGGGAEDIAQRLLPENMRSPVQVISFVKRFRFHYMNNWHESTRLYKNIAELLAELGKLKCKKAVLSNKPEEFVHKIVDYYFPDWQGHSKPVTFTHVFGQCSSRPAKPDPAAALAIAADWQLEPGSIGLMGDSDIDMFTAYNAGMIGIGAVWGFRGKAELLASGAKILLENPLDILIHCK